MCNVLLVVMCNVLLVVVCNVLLVVVCNLLLVVRSQRRRIRRKEKFLEELVSVSGSVSYQVR